jgi:hypothetical protein
LLLVDYKPDVSEAFTKADLGIFQFILAQMKEAKLKQAEYNAASNKVIIHLNKQNQLQEAKS